MRATQTWLIQTLCQRYRHQQHTKHKIPGNAKIPSVWQQAVQNLQADAFTTTLPENELQRWLEWAEWMARNFHRSSSAVEGRNGYLSQMVHNGRGLTEKRLRALNDSTSRSRSCCDSSRQIGESAAAVGGNPGGWDEKLVDQLVAISVSDNAHLGF